MTHWKPSLIYVAISDALETAGFHGRLVHEAATAGQLAVQKVFAKVEPRDGGIGSPRE